MIPSSLDKDVKSSVILLIDDLPVTNGRVAFGRLQNCLYLLVRSTQIPTAILFTNYGEADSADHTRRYLEELQLSLESAGACKVTFLNQNVSDFFFLFFLHSEFTECLFELILEIFRLLSILLRIVLLRRCFLKYADKSSIMCLLNRLIS